MTLVVFYQIHYLGTDRIFLLKDRLHLNFKFGSGSNLQIKILNVLSYM